MSENIEELSFLANENNFDAFGVCGLMNASQVTHLKFQVTIKFDRFWIEFRVNRHNILWDIGYQSPNNDPISLNTFLITFKSYLINYTICQEIMIWYFKAMIPLTHMKVIYASHLDEMGMVLLQEFFYLVLLRRSM